MTEPSDILLRWLTPRTLMSGALLAGAVWTGQRFQDDLSAWLQALRRPSAGVGAVSEPEIMKAKDERESKDVQKRYVRLAILLEQARSEGFDVSGLQAKASAALTLNRPGYRRFAVETLAEVELAVPRKRTQYIPMTAAPSEILIPPDVSPRVKRVPRNQR